MRIYYYHQLCLNLYEMINVLMFKMPFTCVSRVLSLITSKYSERLSHRSANGNAIDMLLTQQLVSLSPRIRNTSVIPIRRRICTHTALYIARTGTRTYVHSRYCVACITCVYVRWYVPRCYPETEGGCASSNGTLVYRLTVVRSASDSYSSCTYHAIVNTILILATYIVSKKKLSFILYFQQYVFMPRRKKN